MDLLTFGEVIQFAGSHYVWLAIDSEEEKLHLAMILDMDKTKSLISIDKFDSKKHKTHSADAPIFAYVVLSTEDFEGRAAFLMKSDEHATQQENFSILGKLNDIDIKGLKERILDGTGLPPRLVNLIKKLDDE